MSANPMSRRAPKKTPDAPQTIADTFKAVEYRKTSFTLEKSLHAEMKAYAAMHDMTVGDLVHKALRNYMAQNQ